MDGTTSDLPQILEVCAIRLYLPSRVISAPFGSLLLAQIQSAVDFGSRSLITGGHDRNHELYASISILICHIPFLPWLFKSLAFLEIYFYVNADIKALSRITNRYYSLGTSSSYSSPSARSSGKQAPDFPLP